MSRTVDPNRHAEILDRAVAFIAEHGLAGLTLRKLATSMGVSTNTLSYQFGSKDGLVDAALARARSSSVDMFADLQRDRHGVSVADTIRRLWQWWREEPARFAYPRLNMEAMMASSADGLDPDRRPELLTFWVEYFVERLIAEGYSKKTATDLSTVLLASLSGLVIDLISTKDVRRLDEAVDLLAQLIERARDI